MSLAGMSLGVMAGAHFVPESSATADTTAPPPPPSTWCGQLGTCPPATSTPVTTGQTTTAPPPPQPPGHVTGLGVTPVAHQGMYLSWTLPTGSPKVAAVIVRRAAKGNCATSPTAGRAIGSDVVRSHQLDTTAANGVAYCYSVFTESAKGKYSAAVTTTAEHGFLAPYSVSDLKSQLAVGKVTLSWSIPAGATGILVVRSAAGGACPATPKAGTQVGPQTRRSSQVDTAVKGGDRYCYSVFALGKGGTRSPAVQASGITVPLPPPRKAPPSKPAPSSSLLNSTLVRVVGAVVAGVITFALVLLLGLRLLPGGRGGAPAAAQPYAVGNGRMRAASIEPAALVIPALMVVLAVGLAVVAAFLLL